MATTPVTFDLTPEALATLDEIAANMETDRATVLREAVMLFLANVEREQAEDEESERQIDAGNYLTTHEVEARFEAMIAGRKAA